MVAAALAVGERPAEPRAAVAQQLLGKVSVGHAAGCRQDKPSHCAQLNALAAVYTAHTPACMSADKSG